MMERLTCINLKIILTTLMYINPVTRKLIELLLLSQLFSFPFEHSLEDWKIISFQGTFFNGVVFFRHLKSEK